MALARCLGGGFIAGLGKREPGRVQKVPNWLLGVISQPRLLTHWAQSASLSLENEVHRPHSQPVRFTTSHRRGWEGTRGNDFLDFGVRTSLRPWSCSQSPLPVRLPLKVLPTSVAGTTHCHVAQAASLRLTLNSSPPLTPGSNLPNTSQAPPLPLHSTSESMQHPLSPGHCRGS